MERVSERAPLLIGVTGSRFFDRFDAAADRDGAARFAVRFSACLDYLDRHFASCPKVLLCGSAFGVDLTAAGVALARGPHWSVAALLPFESALFAEDFVPDPDELEKRWRKLPRGSAHACPREVWTADWEKRYGEHREAFERVLGAGRDRVLVRELPRLLIGAEGDRATDSQLSRTSPTRDPALRREHYEQVGQWIAEAATVLFAHTSESGGKLSAAADGCTARVVAFRRIGRPFDRAGSAVAQRSSVLRREWSEVLRSHGRDVWLVDGGPPRVVEHDPPAAVLGRRSAFDTRTDWSPFEPCGGEVFEDDEETRPAPLDTLVVPALVERLHRRAAAEQASGRRATEGWWASFARRGGVAWGCFMGRPCAADMVAARNPDPRRAVSALRGRLGTAQALAKRLSDWTARSLAAFFALGVLMFELYADLFAKRPVLLWIYVLLISSSAGLILLARVRRWQPMSEDCRTLSEMLRVQDVFWASGLRDRVDRLQLQGVGRDLAHIPETLTTLLAWIWLDCGWRSEDPARPAGGADVDWAYVRGWRARARRGLAPDERDWVGRQWVYFDQRVPAREKRVRRAAAGSVFLFATAWWLSLFVAGLWGTLRALLGGVADAEHAERLGAPLAAVLTLIAAGSAALPLGWRLRDAALRRDAQEAGLPPRLSAARVMRTLGPSSMSAGALAAAAFAAKLLVEPWGTSAGSPGVPHWIALVIIAVLIAVGGAWRYVADKSVWEAEALEYSDARRRFRLAEHALADELDDRGCPKNAAWAQEIVRELGRLALAENEAWLKSRRERPLTTV